jgi:hypothetical protein
MLLGDHVRNADLDSFRAAWSAYHAEHDAWVQREALDSPEDPERHNRSLPQLYKAADLAVDRLIATNTSAAHAQAKPVDRLTAESISVAITASAISIALSGLLCERAIIRIAFQSSPILSFPRSLVLAFMVAYS